MELDLPIRTWSASGMARDNGASADLTSSTQVVRVTIETPKPSACGPLPRGSGRGRRVGYLVVALAGRFLFSLQLMLFITAESHRGVMRPRPTAGVLRTGALGRDSVWLVYPGRRPVATATGLVLGYSRSPAPRATPTRDPFLLRPEGTADNSPGRSAGRRRRPSKPWVTIPINARRSSPRHTITPAYGRDRNQPRHASGGIHRAMPREFRCGLDRSSVCWIPVDSAADHRFISYPGRRPGSLRSPGLADWAMFGRPLRGLRPHATDGLRDLTPAA